MTGRRVMHHLLCKRLFLVVLFFRLSFFRVASEGEGLLTHVGMHAAG